MNLKAMEAILGSGLLHEGQFGELLKKHFPDATKLDLYGAGVTFDRNGQVVAVSCQGRTVRFDGDHSP